MKLTRRIEHDFYGAHKPPAVASRLGIWCSKITGAGGTVQASNLGSLDLAFDNQNEVANCCLYFGDILAFDVAALIRFEFLAKLTAANNAAVTGFMGLGNARNDAIASITQRVGFTIAANAINGNAVDGTNSQTGKSTGFSLVAVYRRFAIDFSIGNLTQSPPSLSKGGLADVRLFMSNDKGALQQVCPTTRFDISAIAAGNGLQPIFQLQKTSGVFTGTLSIKSVSVEVKDN
jgi:hypothetical protein